MYFKGNPEVPFSDSEKIWVSRVSKTKTFQDVLELAAELYEYAKEQQEKKEFENETPPNMDGSSEDTSENPGTPDQEMESNSDDGEISEDSEDKEWFTDDDPLEREPKHEDPADLDTPSYSYEYDETEPLPSLLGSRNSCR